MSISHKKINELIIEVVNNYHDFSLNKNENILFDKESFIDLCQKIYLIESSTSGLTAQRLTDELRTEILNFSRNMQQEQ